MAENQKQSGASETIQKGAQAAQAIKGAVKAGKAIASAAKGAAAGGPYGAVVGIAWQNRHLIGKILAGALALLMLPILFILMLPSIIFGSLDNPDPDVMNDNSIVLANASEAESAISFVLQESHAAIVLQMQEEQDELTEETEVVIDDLHSQDVYFDSAMLISQYCASKDNYQEINVDDLKTTIEAQKDNLYQLQISTSTKTVMDENEEEKTITVVTFKIAFVGTNYFADHVFKLTEDQKELSMNYAENLNLFLDDNFTHSADSTRDSIADLVPKYPHEWSAQGFQSPLDDDWRTYVTSEFGQRVDPITGKPGEGHTGIDLARPKGTPIYAAKDGVVIKAVTEFSPGVGYGKHVIINHGNGYTTIYGHCDEVLVSVGEEVNAGEQIAKVGTTGRSTGYHLHFEILKDGVRYDPREYLP